MLARLSLFTAVVLLAIATFSIGSASAAVRYASPTGSGTTCSEALPCSLSVAIVSGGSSDEVVVTPGEYGSEAVPLSAIGGPIDVLRGVSPFQKPILHLGGTTGISISSASSIRDIRVRHYGGTQPVYSNGASIDRVEFVTFDGYIGCGASSDYSNSICVSTASGGAGVGSFAGAGGETTLLEYNFRNVTALSTGSNGYGFEGDHNGGYRGSFRFYNSIVRGTLGSFRAETDGVNNSTVEVLVKNVNYSTTSLVGAGSSFAAMPGAANSSADPALVNPSTFDFAPTAGSVAIDAGNNADTTAAQDFLGNPRVSGSAIDVGAVELQQAAPPSAVTAVISGLRIAPKSFRVAKRGSTFVTNGKLPKRKRGQSQVGTLIRFNLSTAAATEFTLQRRAAGRRSAGKCVKQTRSNRRAKACKYWSAVSGKFNHTGLSGPNTVFFNGRWRSRALRTGNYRLTATPTGGKGASVQFKIVR